MDKLKDAIALYGTVAAFARELRLHPMVIHNWIKRGRVPAERCAAVSRATGGRISCADLRPDLFSPDTSHEAA